jgi:hypothetical protein
VLGREPDAAELYLAHFLGAGGAGTLLTALQADPGQSAAALFPQPAAANRAIFYDNGRPRSVAEVMELIRGKVSGAMDGALGDGGAPSTWAQFQAARAHANPQPPAEGPARLPSMAETLQTTFGSAGQLPGRAGEHVGKAYAALRAFDL